MSCRRAFLFLMVVSSILALPHSARAQVNWRTNYNEARKEATEKGLPMVIDFFIVPCPYCDKMEETTFQDGKIVRLMNERFIPLRVNAHVEHKLAIEHLKLESFPTMVLAAPDGKILNIHVGYQDASAFHEHLQRALSGITPPDWMLQEYNKAVKWIGKGEYAPAISALRRIVEDGKGKPVQGSAQKLLNDLDAKARERLDLARSLQGKGQIPEAIKVLTETMQDFAGLPQTKTAAEMLRQAAKDPAFNNGQRSHRAQELLSQAREYYKKREYTLCINRCLKLRSFGDLPEGQEAALLFADIMNNPEWLQNACTSISDQLAEMYLALAESLLKRGQPQQARHWLEQVKRAFPGTHHAESAQIRIEQLQGSPTRPVRVDFQTPPP